MQIAAPHVDVHYQWLEFQEHQQYHLWAARYYTMKFGPHHPEPKRNIEAAWMLGAWIKHAGIVFCLQADAANNEARYDDSDAKRDVDAPNARGQVRDSESAGFMQPV